MLTPQSSVVLEQDARSTAIEQQATFAVKPAKRSKRTGKVAGSEKVSRLMAVVFWTVYTLQLAGGLVVLSTAVRNVMR